MKKIFKFIPAALALVAFASCSNDDFFGEKNMNSAAVDGKTMTAEIEGATGVTRAAFAENKTGNKVDARALVWTAGDSYKVYGELATADKYTLQNASAGKKSGTFDLMTDDYNTEPAFAVFPYDKIEADRASSKLTVNLSDWTYKTCDVKDEGYNQGGFVSDVPMYGTIDANANVTFTYMTALLRVDLTNVPKKSTRLIVVTDRPLTGTFEAELPTDGTLPEIKSPVSNGSAAVNYDFSPTINYTGLGYYGLEISMESVATRTNKTFFVAVPTSNKYKVFDVLVEYNMGKAKKYEMIAQLGNTYRIGAGKSILKWERGKVKTLSKEITVTAGGNTPKDLAAFLKAEWKNFPADEINIIPTAPGTDNPSSIVLDGSANDIFEVPAEVKGKVINIIVDQALDLYSAAGTMTIQDEDAAPVASEALRLINIKGQSTKNVVLNINCPETQISLEAWGAGAGKAAAYGAPAKVVVAEGDMTASAPGFLVKENVTLGNVTVTSGSFISEGTVGNVVNNDNYDMILKGTVSGTVNNNGTGALTVGGGAATTTVTGNITNGDGTKKAGKLTIKKAALAGTVTNAANADNGIEINDVDNLTLTDSGKGAVTIEKVTTAFNNSTINSASSVSIKDAKAVATITYKGAGDFELDKVPAGGVAKLDITNANAGTLTVKNVTGGLEDVQYNGKKAVVIDDITGGSTTTGFNIKNAGNAADFSFTNIKGGTIKNVTYAGTGNVIGTGVNNGSYPVVTTMTTGATGKAGDVTLTDITIGTSLAKNSTGKLTITGVKANFGTITNAAGEIAITGNAPTTNKTIAALTQNGANKVTLKALNALTALNINADADVDYENTVIGTFTLAAGKKSTATGTKASGIVNPVATGAGSKFTPKTDKWDGSTKCPVASNQIYTSASFAKLADAAGAAVSLHLDLDLDSKNFNGIKAGTIATFNGNSHKISNLKAKTGMFATPTVALAVSNLTLDGATITDDKDAGCFMGEAKVNVTFDQVTVSNATVGGTKFEGSSINIGGFIGKVTNGVNVNIYRSFVKTATLKGHYYVGGFIGQVVNGGTVKIMGLGGSKNDEIGSQTSGLTFDIQSKDGVWSTLKNGTVAPFIGGVRQLTALNIYGEYDSFDREASKWNLNFLENEAIKFYGTKRNDLNFIGYTDVNVSPAGIGTYNLKLRSGFEANPNMKLANVASSLDKTKILDIEYNCYLVDSQW